MVDEKRVSNTWSRSLHVNVFSLATAIAKKYSAAFSIKKNEYEKQY